ncbi:MAG TPA: hypothetical protein VFM18_15240 [Methanosarcina sp.]|nr:hypothetical protein [Methanosarcina sp.]
MSNIHIRGFITVPQSIVDHAETIKLENYKVNTPKRFQKHTQDTSDSEAFLEALSKSVGIPAGKLDYVYFSCCRGAEEHVDELPSDKFEDTTFVVPVILPKGSCVMTVENEEAEVMIPLIYEFDHTKKHGLRLEDTESGCVMLMVAVKKAA